jgi:hypothetical protein
MIKDEFPPKFVKPLGWKCFLRNGEPLVQFEKITGKPEFRISDPATHALIADELNSQNKYSKQMIEIALDVLKANAIKEGELDDKELDIYEQGTLAIALFLLADKMRQEQEAFVANTLSLRNALLEIVNQQGLDAASWTKEHLGAFSREVAKQIPILAKFGVVIEKLPREANIRPWRIKLEEESHEQPESK